MRMRRLRRAKGWTQMDLAKKSDLTQAFISQLEAGLQKNPGVASLLRIAKALGVTLEELLG